MCKAHSHPLKSVKIGPNNPATQQSPHNVPVCSSIRQLCCHHQTSTPTNQLINVKVWAHLKPHDTTPYPPLPPPCLRFIMAKPPWQLPPSCQYCTCSPAPPSMPHTLQGPSPPPSEKPPTVAVASNPQLSSFWTKGTCTTLPRSTRAFWAANTLTAGALPWQGPQCPARCPAKHQRHSQRRPAPGPQGVGRRRAVMQRRRPRPHAHPPPSSPTLAAKGRTSSRGAAQSSSTNSSSSTRNTCNTGRSRNRRA